MKQINGDKTDYRPPLVTMGEMARGILFLIFYLGAWMAVLFVAYGVVWQ